MRVDGAVDIAGCDSTAWPHLNKFTKHEVMDLIGNSWCSSIVLAITLGLFIYLPENVLSPCAPAGPMTGTAAASSNTGSSVVANEVVTPATESSSSSSLALYGALGVLAGLAEL